MIQFTDCDDTISCERGKTADLVGAVVTAG